jgi:hypothetical protein
MCPENSPNPQLYISPPDQFIHLLFVPSPNLLSTVDHTKSNFGKDIPPWE